MTSDAPARATADRIEELITLLVRSAPDADAAVVAELLDRLRRISSPLARSLARVIELTVEQLIAPGIAWPPLAMACATLADGLRGTLGDRELEAARYEIETLLPMPDPPAGLPRPLIQLSAPRKRDP